MLSFDGPRHLQTLHTESLIDGSKHPRIWEKTKKKVEKKIIIEQTSPPSMNAEGAAAAAQSYPNIFGRGSCWE